MKIIKNENLIRRNGKISGWVSLASFAILGLAMYLTIARPDLILYAMIAMVVGFILTQIGMYMGNRYGRKPRPDEKLDTGLKGLPGDYTLYHYTTPASHLLVGPAGLWVLLPYHQRGEVVFRNNRWRMKGGGFLQSYMRIFGQESLGRPDTEAEHEIRSLRKHLGRQMDESEIPAIMPLLVFTSDGVEIEAEESPIPVMKLKQVKDFLRQKAKERPIGQMQLNAVKSALAE